MVGSKKCGWEQSDDVKYQRVSEQMVEGGMEA